MSAIAAEAGAMPATAPMRVALVGNPNCGKTALFNLLTGSRQKVANYAGVTVERKEGRLHAPSGRHYAVLDLPGAYSLNAASLDEAVTRDLIRGFYPGEPVPDVLVCVVDADQREAQRRGGDGGVHGRYTTAALASLGSSAALGLGRSWWRWTRIAAASARRRANIDPPIRTTSGSPPSHMRATTSQRAPATKPRSRRRTSRAPASSDRSSSTRDVARPVT